MANLRRKLAALLKAVQDGHHRYKQQLKAGKGEWKAVTEYKALVYKKDELFDIFPKKPNGEEDRERTKQVENSWGIKMGKMEEIYYEDMKSERKMECGRGVDPVWHQAMMRKQRERERLEEYRQQRDNQFRYKSILDIEEMLKEDGSLSPSSGEEGAPDIVEEDDGSQLSEMTLEEGVEEDVSTRKRRKRFVNPGIDQNDPLPQQYRHLRESEQKVKDKTLIGIGNLVAEGLSLNEAAKSVVEIGNVLFDRKWKESKDAETFDLDTLPDPRNMREAIKMQEAQDLDLMVDQFEAGKAADKPLTHYSDSTTKARVGQFVAQGIHVGRDPPFPLPILSIDGETTEDIAMQVKL